MASDPGLASVSEHSSGQRCQNHQEHEVFLSHSGKQKPFVHDLFNEFANLPRFQFNEPFFDVQDSSLPKGEQWRDRLIKAARNCKVAVLILTKDFLTSNWPMLELLYFIDARKTTNPDMKLLPVFYDPADLLPSHLSDQFIEKQWKVEWEKIISTGSSAKLREVSLTIESCKEALRILKNSNGIVAQKGNSFQSLRKDIVSQVIKHLPSGFDPELDPNVEGCRRLCDMISQMFQEDDKGKQCLGLYGMGGSGKTTMCQALCSYFGSSFDYKVYHLQIGSNDRLKSQENLFKRHKELLRKLMGLSQEEIDRIRDPRKVLKRHLETRPVFLAVDDVREDLDSCLEVRAYLNYLCPGSKIIITARSRDIVESVLGRPDYCKPIPNLKEEEALSLFLKIAAPERNLTSLAEIETEILRECLQICFFSLKEGAGGNLFVPTKGGHYHPLALRAVASYFKDQYSKLGSIVRCGKEMLNKQELLFSSDASKSIFDVLGFGFHEIDHVGKQLFIDVALYAPRPGDDKDIFSWLVNIHGSKPNPIKMKLEYLRKMSFLNYEDGKPEDSACMNIGIHDLYREYAKTLVNRHENEDSYKYGVYICDDRYYQAPSVLASASGWAKAPRIRLERWKDVIKVKEWCCVSVIYLAHCETITTISIGREVVNLRELKIHDCSKLEELSWTQEIVSEQMRGVMKLCFVELSRNRSLKILPDFSGCSELRELAVTECSSSVGPLNFNTCSSLQLLRIAGKYAPEVRSLRSCLKLRSVHLTWKSPHEGLLVSNLPSLSELVIAGPSILPRYISHESIVPHGHVLFCQHYPKETVCYELTGISELKNLKRLYLNYIPLGCLPKGLSTIGLSLEDLSLRGCLLSQLVNFSEFPNLWYLSIAQTNVKELRGVGGLKKLKYLDCRFNFRLQKISNLRPSSNLKFLALDQCPELQAIPGLPPRFCEQLWEHSPGVLPGLPLGLSSEDFHRLLLAVYAFVNTAKSAIPPPLFAISRIDDRILGLKEINDKLSHLPLSKVAPQYGVHGVLSVGARHPSVSCDGCMMPLIGARYKARDIRTTYNLCRKCLTGKCHKSNCNFTINSKIEPPITNRLPFPEPIPSAGRRITIVEWSRRQTWEKWESVVDFNGKFEFRGETCCATVTIDANYDLCHDCFTESGCDERDFYAGIHRTFRKTQVRPPSGNTSLDP